ncbi:hypothetical protein PVAP13_9KG345064 [Panicum virgatum]|uniref:Uncharacterized protein n=1 Tax=Panicum virgatum TaxID=38727 RepID=A0A8T0NP90_PANVG|nr:hypothetical protein PVAP13_9KG345064 [Panicum virgatum]KAG2550385.1 hypothetical protein PVAP13_9KG345064 [Panicum virgatum]
MPATGVLRRTRLLALATLSPFPSLLPFPSPLLPHAKHSRVCAIGDSSLLWPPLADFSHELPHNRLLHPRRASPRRTGLSPGRNRSFSGRPEQSPAGSPATDRTPPSGCLLQASTCPGFALPSSLAPPPLHYGGPIIRL